MRSILLGILFAMLILLPVEFAGMYATGGIIVMLNAGLFIVVLVLLSFFDRGIIRKVEIASIAGCVAFLHLVTAWVCSTL